MEAKDTVMKEVPQISMSLARLLSDYNAFNEFQDVIRKDRQAQSEISFKAGRKEVVEWIEKRIDMGDTRWCSDIDLFTEWQAQKKKWLE